MPRTERIEIEDAVATIRAGITSISMPLYRLAGANAPVPKSPEALRVERAETAHAANLAIRAHKPFEPLGQLTMIPLDELEVRPKPSPKRDRNVTAKKELVAQLEDAVWRSVIGICDELGRPTDWAGKLRQERCRALSKELKAQYYPKRKPSTVFSAGSPLSPDDFETACNHLLTDDQKTLIGADSLAEAIKKLSPEIAKLGRLLHLPQERV